MRSAMNSSHIRIFILLISFYFGINSVVIAQDKNIKASAPSVVQAGTAFNYVLSGEKQGQVSLSPPSGVRILAGPSQMVSYRSSNINGRMESVKEVSYTYVMIADKVGDYIIPSAIIKSGRRENISNEVRFKAVNSSSSIREGSSTGLPPAVIVQLITSKRSLYEGEQIVLSTKVLVREQVQITSLNSASSEGFWTEVLEPDEFALNETIEGQAYRTQIIKRDLLTAQRKGEVKIGPSVMDITIQKKIKSRNNFFNDPFFDSAFGSYENVPQSVKSNILTLNIKPLPRNAPENFKGAVGSFKITSSLSKDSIETNDAISLTVKYSGKGNLSLITAPELDFPPDLEVFEPKRVAKLKHDVTGTSGTLSFEYILIPRHPGDYRISPVNISFFNPATARYDRYISDVFEFLATGESNDSENGGMISGGFFRDEVSNLNTDIIYIKTSSPRLYVNGSYLILKDGIYIYFVSGLLMLILSFFLWRKKLEKESDVFYTRNKKAWKKTKKRLKNGLELLKTNDDGFYEEILRAIEEYLADRLSINKSDLSRDKIKSELVKRKLSEEIIGILMQIMDDCEIAKYSTQESADKKKVYENAVRSLTEIEQKL